MSDPRDEEDDIAEPTASTGAVNVSDPAQVKRARRRGKREEDRRREFWTRLFDDPLGRQEMYGLLASGHAFDERFVTGPNGFPSPEATWCEAGEQRLAFRIYLSWLRLAPEGVALMLQEHHPALAPPKR